jgi:cytochrome c-type biogenesis protein CcmF
MIHYLVGNLGHLFVITAFISSMVTAFSYFMATQKADLFVKNSWLLNGKISFYIHATAVLGICVTLFTIIANHYFEYHYAFNYSDRKLASYYLVSTFWNGQEGSFLLWMFWHAVLGIILIHSNKFWEAPVMTVFAFVQAFLAAMILGVVIPGLNIKIGSSPFILLRDAMPDDPTFIANPNFVPGDGKGLNPLLQNYWMVIHPPTLFLGFALTLVPFSFAFAGLWLKKYSEWIRPALPWSLLGGAILGLGILMGGYWAYETLNFGGYWNWDPVENAVFVPWLILIATIHTMISYKNSETALKGSIILAFTTFILILYSTFLTRSGVLGDTSVHAFTDLGLNAQLLIYLGFFAVIAYVLLGVRWKEIPVTEKESSMYSREFWIFIGAITLCMMGFQVLAGTSIPVINKLIGVFGFDSKLAPPADAIHFYSNAQIWFSIVIGVLSAVGQFFWWNKIDLKTLLQKLIFPLLATALVGILLVDVLKVYKGSYAVLLFAGLFTIFSNLKILISLLKSSPGLSGGAVAHIGVGMMLIGVLFSSGYSKIVSLNNTGMTWNREAGDEFNRDNLLLFVNEPMKMWGYDIEYFGERVEPRYHSGYIIKSNVRKTDNKDKVVAKKDMTVGDVAYKANDTIIIKGENTFYEIELRKGNKKYSLYPRAQINEDMAAGGLLASPDIYRTVKADLYTHVSSVMNPREEKEWNAMKETRVAAGAQFFANDYVAHLESVERTFLIQGVELLDTDVAVKARIRVQGEHGDYFAEPSFLIRDKMAAPFPDDISELGLRFTVLNIHPETNEFTIGINTRQKDWVVIKAMEKPFINVLWIGTLVLMVGFGIAMARRYREFSKMKQKGQE